MTRKEHFRKDLRRALGLLRVKVDATGSGLDEKWVAQRLASACIWLSARVMDQFDEEDWSELATGDRRQLLKVVDQFKRVAAAVNPRDSTGQTTPQPASARQQATARESLMTVARLIGEDAKGRVAANRERIIATAAHHGARNVRLFGSLARDEATAESDVDLLVEFEPGRSLLDMGGLITDLQHLLGFKVDVATEKGLHPRIRERILKEAVSL